VTCLSLWASCLLIKSKLKGKKLMTANQADQSTRTVDPRMRDVLEFQLVKYAAGRHITCPNCGNILDANSTVVCSIHCRMKGEEVIMKNCVLCGPCFEKRKAAFYKSVDDVHKQRPDLLLRIVLIDGRTFTRAGRRRKGAK